jgi:pimeloyl-ACP methyl ester carboxylesterase
MTKSPNLVLLPGLDGSGTLFAPLVAALPSWIKPQVISYPPDRQLSLAELANLVAKELPTGEFVLLAESFSGLVALELLAQGRLSARGVICCATFAKTPRPLLLRLSALRRRMAHKLATIPDPLLRPLLFGRHGGAGEVSWLRQALVRVMPSVLEHRLALVAARHNFGVQRFDTPCYYLQAMGDRLVPAGAARWFEQRFSHCQVVRLTGPHLLLQSKPQRCAQLIAGFMTNLVPHADRQLEGIDSSVCERAHGSQWFADSHAAQNC